MRSENNKIEEEGIKTSSRANDKILENGIKTIEDGN